MAFQYNKGEEPSVQSIKNRLKLVLKYRHIHIKRKMNFGIIILSAVAATPAYPSFLRFEPGNKYANQGMLLCFMLKIKAYKCTRYLIGFRSYES